MIINQPFPAISHKNAFVKEIKPIAKKIFTYPIFGLSKSNANFRLSGLIVLECPPYKYLLCPIRKWGKFPP